MASATSSTPRSRSRSKRSTTNLANLRLAPLSTKYEADSKGDGVNSPLRTPYNADSEAAYIRRHPSYLVGQSAPTTPGILSRSGSRSRRRSRVGGGLSRRGSLYDRDDHDNDDQEEDGEEEEGRGADVSTAYVTGGPVVIREADDKRRREIVGPGQIPKAKSEAALFSNSAAQSGYRRSLQQQQQQSRRDGSKYGHHHHSRGRRSGAATPTAQKRLHDDNNNDSWLTHAGAITSALVREDKGQSWIATRQSATSLGREIPSAANSEDNDDDEDDEEEDNYEAMAQLAASTAGMRHSYSYHMGYDGALSPTSVRQQPIRAWGSRYGSRPASNRTSRLASPVGMRTPKRRTSDQGGGGYFDVVSPMAEEQQYQQRQQQRSRSEFHDGDHYDDEDEDDDRSLAGKDGFGLGNMVDRIMNFNLFGAPPHGEGAETTDDDDYDDHNDNDDEQNRMKSSNTAGGAAASATTTHNETAEEAHKRMFAEKERRREEKNKLMKQQAAASAAAGGGGSTSLSSDGKNTGRVQDQDYSSSGGGAGWQDASWLLSVAAKALF